MKRLVSVTVLFCVLIASCVGPARSREATPTPTQVPPTPTLVPPTPTLMPLTLTLTPTPMPPAPTSTEPPPTPATLAVPPTATPTPVILSETPTVLRPTATPTKTPAPTLTPTPTPPPPSPTPLSCLILPEGGFLTIWQSDSDLQTALGCPVSHHPRITPAAWEVKTSYQPFERGEMIWSDHIGWYDQPVVYVLYPDSTYEHFDDTFDPAVDPVSGGETPPGGLVEPILGLGKVWREVPGLRDTLGWATAEETPGVGRFQMFTGGNMVWISKTNQTYVFVEGIVQVFDVPFSEAGWKVYANPLAGFTFKYPEGWTIEEEYFYETLAGTRAEYPTVVLKQIGNEDPNDLIAINQRQFQCGSGKCAEIGPCLIGSYTNDPDILRVFDEIVAGFEVR